MCRWAAGTNNFPTDVKARNPAGSQNGRLWTLSNTNRCNVPIHAQALAGQEVVCMLQTAGFTAFHG